MTNLKTIQASINKANSAKQAARIIQRKYPELLKDPAIQEFVKLLAPL
jgi:hypothetical protein